MRIATSRPAPKPLDIACVRPAAVGDVDCSHDHDNASLGGFILDALELRYACDTPAIRLLFMTVTHGRGLHGRLETYAWKIWV